MRTQNRTGDTTEWLLWFSGCLERALLAAEEMLDKTPLGQKHSRLPEKGIPAYGIPALDFPPQLYLSITRCR